MYRVVKRDGRIVDFEISKIANAMKKAFDATETNYNQSVIDFLAIMVTADFQPKIKDELIHIEDIQDSVESVLSRGGYENVAKAYILYRKQHENLRAVSDTVLDYKKTVDNYLKINDWRVKENSTVTYSVGGLILSNSGAITANYWLSEVYDEEIANAHRNGDLHLHDLSMLTGYCAGWSLKQLIQQGLGIPGKINSTPASHLSTLCNQMVNFLGIMQNEWAGAQAFSSFDTYLAPFVRVDGLSQKEVKQCIQSFIFGVNTPSRWGTQAPFSNITLDWTVPADLRDLPAIVGGKEQDFTYGDCQKEMDMVNKAFIEIMTEGDANGRGFQYPIPTYSITKDFDWSETENNRLLFEMTAKYGTPYFSNYINSDMEPSDVRSMCCRLRLDLRELRKKSGGFFGSGESTGSVGVVTINMPRIAYLAKTEEEFYRRLDRMMDIAARSLKTKRTVITKLLDAGLYPYTKYYLGTFENHFSTIGLVGMNETCLNARWLRNCVTVRGGDVTFVHCTIARFYVFTGGNGVALDFTNFSDTDGSPLPLKNLTFTNSIITGYASDEVMGQRAENYPNTEFNYLFDHSLVNTPLPETPDEHWRGCFQDKEESTEENVSKQHNFAPEFDLHTLFFSFQLNEKSKAVGNADPAVSAATYPTDLLGQPRGTAPDMGCYQHVPEVKE